MLEYEGFGLFTVTLRAGFIQSGHAQAPTRFANVTAMGIMALNAIHFSLNDRVMLRQIEFSVLFRVTIKTRGRVLAGIENEFPAATAKLDVLAAGTVTGFATALAGH